MPYIMNTGKSPVEVVAKSSGALSVTPAISTPSSVSKAPNPIMCRFAWSADCTARRSYEISPGMVGWVSPVIVACHSRST